MSSLYSEAVALKLDSLRASRNLAYLLFVLACAFVASAHAAIEPEASPPLTRLDSALARMAPDEQLVDVLIALPEAPNDAPVEGIFARVELVAGKRATFESAAGDIVEWLEQGSYLYRGYWIANAIWARVPARVLGEIAARSDVRFVASDPKIRGIDPQVVTDSAPKAINAIEWGISRIRAPEAWAEGVLGAGAVVAGADTGYEWDHPALKNQYRGWNAQTGQATHDYNWHDAIHALINGGTNFCGLDSAAPCDDGSHGTHTMGTMVGSDGGANQIGVAPQARWIGCRNMEAGIGTPSTYIECMQFFAAPTDAQGNNPRPDLAPHVINNSWGCPPDEGCTAQTDALMATAIRNLHDLGIVFVVSAGNSGSSSAAGCGTVSDPPATLALSFTVGATTSAIPDAISSFSSRGPIGGRLAPAISAPGSSIRSAVRDNGYGTISGTSMAGPHVAGAVALLVSRYPWLANHPARVRSVLESTAVPRTSAQSCGNFPGSAVPNAVFGHGRLDVKAALDSIDDYSIGAEVSGLWFNPLQDGHGLNLEVIDQGGVPRLLLYWYTYRDGRPLWLFGVGDLVADRTRPIELYETSGADFPPDFRAADFRSQAWGSAELAFASAQEAQFSWRSLDGASSGSMPMVPITRLRSPTVDAARGGRPACFSGAWFNPAQSGHGLQVGVFDGAGGQPHVTVIWYAFNDARPIFLVGTAPSDANGARVPMQAPRGAQIPPAFRPGDVVRENWGEIDLRFTGEDTATVTWTPTAMGYTAGSLGLSRLTRVRGQDCN